MYVIEFMFLSKLLKNNKLNSYALSFYRSQNVLCPTKNLFTYSGSHKDEKKIFIQ